MNLRLGVGLLAATIAIVAASAGGCSRTNNVDQSTELDVGQQCSGPDDKGCGQGAVCALGFCRLGCTTDAACPQGAICVGDQAPFGCSLPAELACSSSQPCASSALECGIDGVCRLPCKADADCSRNEHHCIAGSCVGDGERAYPTWSACAVGATRCDGTSFQECNVSAPGWVEAANCGASQCTMPEGRCIESVVNGGFAGPALELTINGDALYWFDALGQFMTSALKPGSAPMPAFDLKSMDAESHRLNGPLVAVVGYDGTNTFAQMYRVDGTPLIDVKTGTDPQAEPRLPMPTTAGLFWIESIDQQSMPTPALMYLSLTDTTPTELGNLPETATYETQRFCTLGDSLYFLTAGQLYRASAEAGLEGPLDAGAGSDIVCRKNDVVIASATGLSSRTPDGKSTPLLQHPFSSGGKGAAVMTLAGDHVLAFDAQQSLIAADLVTGEVRTLAVLGANTSIGVDALTANETHAFLAGWQPNMAPGSAPRIVRVDWQ